MIIGIDASRANKHHKSGTEWYSYYLIRWLAKLDPNNQYILYTDKPLTEGLLDLTTGQHYNDLEINYNVEIDKHGWQKIKSPYNNFRAKVLKWPFSFSWTQGRLSLEMLKRPVDILFVPAHALPLIRPKYSIVTIHDIGFEKDYQLYGRESIGPVNLRAKKALNILVKLLTRGKSQATTWDYLRWSTEFSIKKATHVITVSNYSRNDIIEYYKVDPSKISAIHNGYNRVLYDKTIDQGRVADVLIKYGIEQPYFLYVGRIEKKKNIPLLIEAYAILRDNNKKIRHKLVLIGDASYGYDEVQYMIREFNLTDTVIMPGWIEEEDMPHLFNGAEIFVFPSQYEGFGIPLLQAMACGLPIIASNSSSIPEVVNGAALLFDPSYALSIAKAMETILNEPELAGQLAKKGREQVRNFSWEKCARETLDVINSKIAGEHQ